jgi:hypothetical protein
MPVPDERIARLLADAREFFEAQLWESPGGGAGREALAEHGLHEKVIRAFGVGYAPVGPHVLSEHLRGLGYSSEETVAAGLANRSPRGRAHTHFRSRVMFPVRDREGRTLGFAALGTHLGPSWALWTTSPDTGLYRRSEAVFGIDRAARRIAASGKATVEPDCLEVLRAHHARRTNAVTVHSNEISLEQIRALANGVSGGADALGLELPPGIDFAPKRRPSGSHAPTHARPRPADQDPPHPDRLNLRRLGLVTATGVVAMNAWTGAPLLAVWVGSQAQSGRVLNMRGVVTVLVVLAALEFLLLLALTWLSTRYDELTGRPITARQTSPWHRAKRGDRVQDIRGRYGVSAPEKVVAATVAAALLVFEIWFFFFAGSSLGSN